MVTTLALYITALDDVRAELDALAGDLDIVTFDAEGRLHRGATEITPEETEVDYCWFSQRISRDRAQAVAFDMAQRFKRLDVLQTFNAGLDDPVYKKIAARGTRICNSSAQAVAISEYVFGQVLSLFQPIQTQRAQQAEKKWATTPFREIWRTEWLILGFGPIGREVAKKAKAFGASTTVLRRSPQTSETVDRAGTLADLTRYAADADVVVVACPLNDRTRGALGEDFFAALKPGATLVNIARGPIIDDAALIGALDSGKAEHAVLDVFHTEPLPARDRLWSHPKIWLTPHTSFAGSGGLSRWRELFLDNFPRYLKGEPLENEVRPEDI